MINAGGSPRRFGEVADPWQRELIAPKIPAINRLAGIPTGGVPYNGPTRFLDILARGHDKSSLEARIANFLAVYSRNPIDGKIVAADRDQGKIIVNSAKAEAAVNPWYADRLKFGKYEISGPGGVFEVVPADASGSFGFQSNFYVLDEVTHWSDGVGKKVYETIASGLHKVPGTVVVAIMNAWIKGGWAEELLIRKAMTDPARWVTFYREGNLASWMTPADLAEARALLPDAVAARLLDNVPIDPVVEAGYIRPADVDACEDPAIDIHHDRRTGYQYVLSVDLGLRRDRAVLFRGHMDEFRRAITDTMIAIDGSRQPDGRVSIAEVDKWLDDVIAQFKPAAVVLDPWQLEATVQRLERKGVPVIRFNSRGGYGNMDLAMGLRNMIGSRRFLWAPMHGYVPGALDDTFKKELVSLVTRVMPYGWRLDHESGKHDDRAVAAGMALTELVKFPYVAPEVKAGEPVKVPPARLPYGYETPPPEVTSNPLSGR